MILRKSRWVYVPISDFDRWHRVQNLSLVKPSQFSIELEFWSIEIQPLLIHLALKLSCATISFLKSSRVVGQRLKDGSGLSQDQSCFSPADAWKLLSLSHPFV
jgi:hypothetical protein